MAGREKDRRLSFDALAIIFFGLAVLSFISLVSYSSLDPSFSNSVRAKEYYNALGWFGAHLADVLFLVFGYTGFLIPVFLVFLSYIFLFRRFSLFFKLQTLGVLLLFLVITSLMTLIVPVSEGFKRYHKSGGSVGSVLLGILTPYRAHLHFRDTYNSYL